MLEFFPYCFGMLNTSPRLWICPRRKPPVLNPLHDDVRGVTLEIFTYKRHLVEACIRLIMLNFLRKYLKRTNEKKLQWNVKLISVTILVLSSGVDPFSRRSMVKNDIYVPGQHWVNISINAIKNITGIVN